MIIRWVPLVITAWPLCLATRKPNFSKTPSSSQRHYFLYPSRLNVSRYLRRC